MRYVSAQPCKEIALGRQGENKAVTVQFDVSGWAEMYGNGEFALLHQRSMDTEAYPCTITTDSNTVSWQVNSADVYYAGTGMAQLMYIVNDVVAKSVVYTTITTKSLDSGDEPDPVPQWAADVIDSGLSAEAYAVGTRNGESVSSDDPAYHNNAKYYAENFHGVLWADTSTTSAQIEEALSKNQYLAFKSNDQFIPFVGKYYRTIYIDQRPSSYPVYIFGTALATGYYISIELRALPSGDEWGSVSSLKKLATVSDNDAKANKNLTINGNTLTENIELTAEDIPYDEEETYEEGTVGYAVKDLMTTTLKDAVTLKSTDDLNNILTTGVYRWTTNSNSPINSPTAYAASMLCFSNIEGAAITNTQVVFSRGSTMYWRTRYQSAWQDWVLIQPSNTALSMKTISSQMSSPYDLNNLSVPGMYAVGSSTDVANDPLNGQSHVMLQLTTDTSGYPSVQLGIGQSDTIQTPKVVYRYHTSGGFADWVTLFDANNIHFGEYREEAQDITGLQVIITGSDLWGSKTNKGQSYLIPVPQRAKKVSFTVKDGGVVAFLRSFASPVVGQSPDFASEYPHRYLYRRAGREEFRLYDDVKYIYVTQKSSTGTDVDISDVEFSNVYVPEFLQELPVLNLSGDVSTMSKNNAVTLDYNVFNTFGTCSCKWQGSSSQRYVKKNYTINFSTGFDGWSKWANFVNDLRSRNGNISTIPTTSRWGTQTKYCFKANWIDPSHARNIVCARLWGQIVKNRIDNGDIDDKREDAPNYGAIDGFPIEIRLNNKSVGLYTMNIPKGNWQFAMGSGEAEYLLSAESNSENACKWKATAAVDGDDYSIEYAPDGVEASTIATSLNAAISIAINGGATWETDIADYLDVDSAIDYFIFACCINGTDIMAHNILYGTYDGTKWFMSAYDLDTTFGGDPYGSSWTNVVNSRCQFAEVANFHRLAYLIYNYSSAKLKARYQELRAGVLSNANVWHELSQFIVDIPQIDYDINNNIWTSEPGTATINMAQFMEFYRMHTDYLDAEIAAL